MTTLMLHDRKTPAMLRVLAKKIEDNKAPDFCVIISDNENFCYTHKSENNPYTLIGGLELEKMNILMEQEDD